MRRPASDDSTGRVKGNGIKLMNVTGAYWRGDAAKQDAAAVFTAPHSRRRTNWTQYLNMLEEAKKRDHRKLGKELGLFMLTEEGPGFPFFLPKGMTLKNTLIDYWREIHKRYGYVEVSTPMILNRKLWETLRSLGSLQAEYVHHRHRRRGLRNQADELPGRHAGLQGSAALLPGAAAACRRAGSGTPPRAVRRSCTV